jgi:hypothetical protein
MLKAKILKWLRVLLLNILTNNFLWLNIVALILIKWLLLILRLNLCRSTKNIIMNWLLTLYIRILIILKAYRIFFLNCRIFSKNSRGIISWQHSFKNILRLNLFIMILSDIYRWFWGLTFCYLFLIILKHWSF